MNTQTSDKKTRNSSIELLRIICIIMILFHHYAVHGGWPDFTVSDFSWRVLFIQWISLGGKLACNVFILITGYFLIQSKPSIKKICLLIGETVFYSVTIAVIIYFYDKTMIDISPTQILRICMAFIHGNWFACVYIILCILSPFLNAILLHVPKNLYIRFFACISIIYCIIPYISGLRPLRPTNWQFSNIDSFIIMYIIGAYIKIYGIKNEKTWHILGVITAVLFLSAVPALDFCGIVFNKNMFIEFANKLRDINTIFVVILSIELFLLFYKKQYSNSLINTIALSTFGIYLIHDNAFIRKIIWTRIYPNVDYLNSNLLPIHAILKVLIVFCVCFMIDWIRLHTLHPLFNKICDPNLKIYAPIKKGVHRYTSLFEKLFS